MKACTVQHMDADVFMAPILEDLSFIAQNAHANDSKLISISQGHKTLFTIE